MRRKSSFGLVLALLLSVLTVNTSVAVGNDDPLKTQSELDAPAGPNDGNSQGGWGDLKGGVEDRPYVSKLSFTNPGSEPVNITPAGGTTDPEYFTSNQLGNGDVTVVVEPYNLCKEGVAPAQGVCYAQPNRVAVSLGFVFNGSVHRDFARPASGQAASITKATEFDMTVNLNTIGSALRWSQLYGDLTYWKTANLGLKDASVQLKFRPTDRPEIIGDYNTYRGCYNIPQTNCPINHPTGTYLEASLVLSLEVGYGESLTGAVFSVANGMSGEICDGTFQLGDAGSNAPWCRKDASPTNPVMEFQMAGMHFMDPAHTIETKASMKAFIPSGALLNIYGITPEDAAKTFLVSRATAAGKSETGKNDPPTFTPWTAAVNGSDGLLVAIDNVTFSTPKYKIKRKISALNVYAKQLGSSTKLTPTYSCSTSSPCVVKVFKLNKKKYIATVGSALATKTFTTKNPSVYVASSKLKKGERYLITLRSKTGTLKSSTVGTVG
jgi:hypothetical protein